MTQALIVSSIVSWFAILTMGIALFALSRQIGVLHERIRPVGALSMGQALTVGDVAPSFQSPSLTGGMARIGGASFDGRVTLLFFLSADCPVCKTLLPAVVSIGRQEAKWLRLVFASDGNESDHERLIESHGLNAFSYVLSTEIGMGYQVAKLPYCYLLDESGLVSAHGLVNNREHLESLFEAHQVAQKEEANVGQMA